MVRYDVVVVVIVFVFVVVVVVLFVFVVVVVVVVSQEKMHKKYSSPTIPEIAENNIRKKLEIN